MPALHTLHTCTPAHLHTLPNSGGSTAELSPSASSDSNTFSDLQRPSATFSDLQRPSATEQKNKPKTHVWRRSDTPESGHLRRKQKAPPNVACT